MNNKLKLILVGLLLVLLGAIGGYSLPRTARYLKAEGDTNYTNLVLSGYANISGRLDVTGNINSSGTLGMIGESHLGNLVFGDANGTLPGITITSTSTNEAILTAAQECDNSVVDVSNSVSGTGTVRFASTTAMAADCLTAAGDTRTFLVINASTTAGTSYLTFAVGGSSTLVTAASATSSLDGREVAVVNVYRITSSSQPWTIYWYSHAQ